MDLILKAITLKLILLQRLFSGAHDLDPDHEKSEIDRLLLEAYRLCLLLQNEHNVTDAVLLGNAEHYVGSETQQAIQRYCFKIFNLYLMYRNETRGTYKSVVISRNSIAGQAKGVLIEIQGHNIDFVEEVLDKINYVPLEQRLKLFPGTFLPPLPAQSPFPKATQPPQLKQPLLPRSTPMQEAFREIVDYFDAMERELEKDVPDERAFNDSLKEIAEVLLVLQRATADLRIVEEQDEKLKALDNPQYPRAIETDPNLKLLRVIVALFKFCHDDIANVKSVLGDYKRFLATIKANISSNALVPPRIKPPAAAAAAKMPRPSLDTTVRRSVRASMAANIDDILQYLDQELASVSANPYKTIIDGLNEADQHLVPSQEEHVARVSRYANITSYKDEKFPFYSANCLPGFICVAEGPNPKDLSHMVRFFASAFHNPFFAGQPIGAIVVAGKPDEKPNSFLNYLELAEPLVIAAKIKDELCRFEIKSNLQRTYPSGNILLYEVAVTLDGGACVTLPVYHLPNFKDFSVATLTKEDVEILYKLYKKLSEANPPQNLFIHCAAGRGRTGVLALAYLLAAKHDEYYNGDDPILPKVQELLGALRKTRPGLVQTPEQLEMAVKLGNRFHVVGLAIAKQKREQQLITNADRTNTATLHFTCGTVAHPVADQRLYDEWYTQQTLRYLVHLHYHNKNDAVAYVFEAQQSRGFSLAEQLSALIQLKNRDGKKRACFILTEPAEFETSHFIFGVLTDKNILFINPTGRPTHTEFYEQLTNPFVAVLLSGLKNIYISEDVFQRDANGLMSCGPITAELAISFASLSADDLDRGLSRASIVKSSQPLNGGKEYKFTSIKIADLKQECNCLSESLTRLLEVQKQYYKNHIEEMRRRHFETLQRAKANWESLYNAPPQVAIFTHCSGGGTILAQASAPGHSPGPGTGSFDPLSPPSLISSRSEDINLSIEFIFYCLATFSVNPNQKLEFITRALFNLHNNHKGFRLFDGNKVSVDPAVSLPPPDNTHNQNFHNLFRAFCTFLQNESYRVTLLSKLPEIRGRFVEYPPDAVKTYAMRSLNIKEADLAFINAASSRIVSLESRRESKKPGSAYSLPPAASPAKAKGKVKLAEAPAVDPTYCYTDEHISVALNAIVNHSRVEGGEIGGHPINRTYLLAGINADGTFNEDGSSHRYFVAITTSVLCVAPQGIACTPIDYFIDKDAQGGPVHERHDVFDELVSVMKANPECHIKILFPFNDNSYYHWFLGEIRIHQAIVANDQVNIAVDIYAHDPFGGGKMPPENYKQLCIAIEKRINAIYQRAQTRPMMMFNSEISRYERRQAAGDTYACGPIVVDDLRLRILGHSLNRRLFPVGAVELRQFQLDTVTRVQHVIVADSTKKAFRENVTGVSATHSKSKMQVRSTNAYSIADMDIVMHATKVGDVSGGLASHCYEGCTYLLHEMYPEHQSENWYYVAILPAISLAPVQGDPTPALPIDTYLDRKKNVNACSQYILNALKSALSGNFRLEEIRKMTFTAFKLMMNNPPFNHLEIDPSVKEVVLQNVFNIVTAADFSQEKLDAFLTMEEVNKHADVFEDLYDLFAREEICNVKVLFPLRLPIMEGSEEKVRHFLVEIIIHRNKDTINVGIFAHDPRGKGQLPSPIYRQLATCVQAKLPTALIYDLMSSPFETRRVAHGDRATAPAIVVEELFNRIRGEALTKTYPATAQELRRKHAQRVEKIEAKDRNRNVFLRRQVVVQSNKTGFSLNVEKPPAITTDKKLNLAYFVYKLRGICRELLNDNVDQAVVDKKFTKLKAVLLQAQKNCVPDIGEQLVFFDAKGDAKNPPVIITGIDLRTRAIAGCFEAYQFLYIIFMLLQSESIEPKARRDLVRPVLKQLEKLRGDSKKLMPPLSDFVEKPRIAVTGIDFAAYQHPETGDVAGVFRTQTEIDAIRRRTRWDSVKRWGGIAGGTAGATGGGWLVTSVATQYFPLDAYLAANTVIPAGILFLTLVLLIYFTRNCCLRPYHAETTQEYPFSFKFRNASIQTSTPNEQMASLEEGAPLLPKVASRTPHVQRRAVVQHQIGHQAGTLMPEVSFNQDLASAKAMAEARRSIAFNYRDSVAVETDPNLIAAWERINNVLGNLVTATAATINDKETQEAMDDLESLHVELKNEKSRKLSS